MPYTPPVTLRPPTAFRHAGTADVASGPTLKRRYLAGTLHSSGVNLATNFSSVIGRQWALPYYTGRGGTIDAVQIRYISGTSNWRLGCYANTSPGVLYPSTQMYATTEQTQPGAPGFGGPTGLSWVMPADSLVWFVYVTSAVLNTAGLPIASQWPLLGHSDDSANYLYPGNCWIQDTTYGVLPATFDTQAVTGLNSLVPAIFLRYSA